ncbi:biotin/lipoyl-containing protein [Dactylosporangium sp. NPDC049525]|uniref:acetyl-CoA carboxylase biotin carboxyl carrier protein n=1 Tax=Dactylosporangium sp. NPDC049525 TaxID=3154730 RepID=UPI0034333569
MTDVLTTHRPEQTDAGPQPAGPDPLADVGGSVLRLLAALPALPGRIRVEARGVAVELEWPPPASGATPTAPVAAPSPAPPAVPPAVPPPGDHRPAGVHEITADTVGTFYRGPEPGAPAFVQVGTAVRAGQQLAVLEAMKLMIPVKADVSGRVQEILKDDGQPVEFGEPLLLIERD